MKSFSAFSMFLLASFVIGVLSDGENTTETTVNATSSSKSTVNDESVNDDPNSGALTTVTPTKVPNANQPKTSPPLIHDITSEVTTTKSSAALPDTTNTIQNKTKGSAPTTPDKKDGNNGVSRVSAEFVLFSVVALVISGRFS